LYDIIQTAPAKRYFGPSFGTDTHKALEGPEEAMQRFDYRSLLISLAFSCGSLGPLYAQSAAWSFQDIAYPGAQYTEVYGINAKGQVVGDYQTNNTFRGFLLSGSSFSTIAFPGVAYATIPLGINSQGQIVGEYQNVGSSPHGFFLNGSNFSTIDFPGASSTYAGAINDASQIAGTYWLSQISYRGFIGGMSVTFPGALVTGILGLNNTGQAVGVYEDQNGHYHGFLLSGGSFSSIDFPGAQSTKATGINDKGLIVGSYATATGSHGFLLSGGSFDTITFPGSTSTEVFGINAAGQVVGRYFGSVGQHGFVATPVLYGLDLSSVPSSSEWSTLVTNFNPSFVIADAWGGGSEKPAQQILASAPSGLKKAAYLLLNYDDPSQSGSTQVGYALEALGNQYQPSNANGNLAFMAVDIEPICYQTDTHGNCTMWEDLPQDLNSIAARIQRIYDAIQAVERAGLNPVIYSNRSAWTQIAGGTIPSNIGLPFGCLPLWNPQYDITPDLGTIWQSFAAWNQRAGKQYAENDAAFGSTLVDLDVFNASIFSGGSWGMALDYTNSVVISRSGFRLNRGSSQYVQTVTVQNTSSSLLQGPVSLVLDALSSNAALVNGNNYTSCTMPSGSSVVNLQSSPLSPGQSAVVTLQFSNPTNQGIIYTPRVLGGPGAR
jgi:hypothetical protein